MKCVREMNKANHWRITLIWRVCPYGGSSHAAPELDFSWVFYSNLNILPCTECKSTNVCFILGLGIETRLGRTFEQHRFESCSCCCISWHHTSFTCFHWTALLPQSLSLWPRRLLVGSYKSRSWMRVNACVRAPLCLHINTLNVVSAPVSLADNHNLDL